MPAADRQKPPPGALYLDHVSHFVADLDAAAAALARVGFAVTPASAQRTPQGALGTANRCVMLQAGYLELLSPPPEGGTGLRLVAFGTPHAEAERRRLADHGFEPQPLVELSREVEGGTVRFRVARVAPGRMPEGRIQYVEQLAPELIWREPHLAHDNGVTGLAGVVVCAEDPVQAAARWARFTGLLPRRAGDAILVETDRGRILIQASKKIEALFGAAPAPPALAGYVLACRNPDAFARRCDAAGLRVTESAEGFGVRLPESLGGAWLLQGERRGEA